MKTSEFNHQASSSAIIMVALAALVGILGALGAILFRKMISFTHNLFFLKHIYFSYNENIHTPANVWGMGIIFVPVIGGLIVIWLIEKYASDQRGLSVPEIMYTVFCKNGKIRPSIALTKTIASAITIGTGGSVGREGPVFQIGAALSSLVSDFTRLSPQQRKVLIASGAAACTAVIFHTPVSGIIFATEFLLVQFSIFSIILLIISTMSAIIIEYTLINVDPIFSLKIVNQLSIHLTFQTTFLLILFGMFIGIFSILFIRGIYSVEDFFNSLIKNVYLRHVAGMLIVGCMLYMMIRQFGHFYIEGIGYATIQDCLNNQILNPWLLLLLVAAKLLATCLTLGSGASGGIFSPSLFMGATLGSALGIFVNYLFPSIGIDPVFLALIGMAAMLGSTTGALITSISLLTEMTRTYHFILPLVIAVLVSYIIRRYFCRENIYSLKLYRRGIDLHWGFHRYFNEK